MHNRNNRFAGPIPRQAADGNVHNWRKVRRVVSYVSHVCWWRNCNGVSFLQSGRRCDSGRFADCRHRHVGVGGAENGSKTSNREEIANRRNARFVVVKTDGR